MASDFIIDAEERLLIVDRAPVNGVSIWDAQRDIYSALKEEWNEREDLRRVRFPLTTIGGEPISGEVSVGAFFFLDTVAGWRVRPFEADHELRVVGNLFSIDPDLPMMVPTLGDFTVATVLERSSLTQAIGLTQIREDVAFIRSRTSRSLIIQ